LDVVAYSRWNTTAAVAQENERIRWLLDCSQCERSDMCANPSVVEDNFDEKVRPASWPDATPEIFKQPQEIRSSQAILLSVSSVNVSNAPASTGVQVVRLREPSWSDPFIDPKKSPKLHSCRTMFTNTHARIWTRRAMLPVLQPEAKSSITGLGFGSSEQSTMKLFQGPLGRS